MTTVQQPVTTRGAAAPPTPADLRAILTLAALRGVENPNWSRAGLTLSSRDLIPTRGFDDGHPPTEIEFAYGDWTGTEEVLPRVVWHTTLWELVHAYLLPAMGWTPPLTFWPCHRHNPVRAWDLTRPGEADFDPTRPADEVFVDWMTVLAHTVHVANRIINQGPLLPRTR
jgi:hypothetical protein